MSLPKTGLINAFVLDGSGSAENLNWQQIRAFKLGSAPIWIHLDRAESDSQQWLRDESGLNNVVVEALLDDISRPSLTPFENGFLLNLRGVNLSNKKPGTDKDANVEDMVFVQIWWEADRIITTRHRNIMAIADIRRDIVDKFARGPGNTGDLIISIVDRLLYRIGKVITELELAIDDIDEKVTKSTKPDRATQNDLSELRTRSIGLRRYLAPQRGVLFHLHAGEFDVFDDDHRMKLNRLVDRNQHMVEELDAARDRAAVVQDNLTQRMSERIERVTLVLTIVAAIFLPLALLTGLMGINTGVPGEGELWGFGAVLGIMILMTLFEVWLFRRTGIF